MDFIQNLKEEHKEICAIFAAIDVASNLENKKALTQKLQSFLGPHLKKEDDQLYPVLAKSPEEEVRRMANIFSLTMGGYAKNLDIVVSEIMSASGGMSVEIEKDYENIRDKIKDRITIEEVTIFPEYKKISIKI